MEPPAGYQEIAGTRLGYLRVGGRQLFALAQVLSGPLRGVPRGRVCRRMERLQIQSRRCDLRELRALKALRSVPNRAVQCCLISREDLLSLCSSSWGPNISKDWTPTDDRPCDPTRKECVPSRMRATFPSDLNLFQGPLQSPSAGYSSSSDAESESSASSDSSVLYRSVDVGQRSRQIITRSKDGAKPCRVTRIAKDSTASEQTAESKSDECDRPQDERVNSSGAEETASPPEKDDRTAEPDPRVQQFDRLVRKSKLWCYARGFTTDLRDFRSRLAHKQSKGGAARRPGRPKGRARLKKKNRVRRATKFQSRKAANPQHPARPPFSFLGNFPAPPSLVVGADGDLCPAYTLRAADSKSVARTHPVWGWHPGGSAIPLPPSLKFRAFPVTPM